ncbi:MAG TPA: hypothetical protein VFV32_00600 [Acidimicrobiales bacterium]|nr:hypothetical protein [Acidimicrobiales bacterium]
MRGHLRALLGALVLGLALSGCRLGIDVNVAVEEDGSGTVEVVVTLDPDAMARIGGDLKPLMELDDLIAAGWRVEGPTKDSDGSTRVRISHPFGTADEAASVFAQIAGEDGPFQDFAVTRKTSLAETNWGFTGRVDFSGGLAAFGDAGLAAELDGQPIGQSEQEIEDQLGESLSRLIQVRVSARLPGDVSSNATTKADNGAVWQVGFGDRTVDLRAEGTERRWSTILLGAVAVVCALALVILLLVRLAKRVTAKDGGGTPPAHVAS